MSVLLYDHQQCKNDWQTPDWDNFLQSEKSRLNITVFTASAFDYKRAAVFYRWRIHKWFLEPARVLFEAQRFSEPYNVPGHMGAFMILACCVGTLAENWERRRPRRPDTQPKQIERFLTRNNDAEWCQVVNGETAAHRFGESFRNALVHDLRIRRGDDFRSDPSTTAFCTPVTRGGVVNARFHSVKLFDKVDEACKEFLDALTDDATDYRDEIVRYILDFLDDKKHTF